MWVNNLNIINIEFLSTVLNSRKHLNIIMPEFSDMQEGEKLPLIYCLHGLTGNCNDWLYSGGAKDIFKDYKFIAVFPSADNSFYSNIKYGQKYFDYIAYEVPNYIEKFFPADTTKRYIAGLSMGGYGALKIAFRNPERFVAAAAFSGVLDIEDACNRLNNDEVLAALIACFGKELKVLDEDNLFKLAKRKDIKMPIYISCGTEDFLYHENVNFVKSNPQLNIRFITEPGEHEWRLWHKNLAKFMEEISK